ncbi:HlyD family secretion protein [Photobacterium rosenbergii]|uniref:HlyD family secretion protein n=1 Tax=Photobacterium rosenbergii TaxID=294936 RepID=A0A2T3NKN5_9GAMM|nr:HlyD family secretion protein [Photobacterium rosenbergii]PSW16085.1 HlyD family secretion protein [Photobacterium rosenbergii]
MSQQSKATAELTTTEQQNQNQVTESNIETDSQKNSGEQARDPRRATLITLLVCAGLFIFYLVSDRVIPTTDMARVRANIVPLAPLVSGPVTKVHVEPNDIVEAGQPLIELDRTDYVIALKQAEEDLEKAGKEVGVQTASVESAQAQLSDAIANQQNVRRQADRVFAMVKKGIVTQADADKTHAALAQASARVDQARASVDQAKKQLGAKGNENTEIQAAILALQKAQLDLERTVIRAPSAGAVTNFRLDEGIFANKGQPLMTFVSGDESWVEAYYRENSLGNVKPGDKVEIALDNVPGEVFAGEVTSIDYGVDWGQAQQTGQLATVTNQSGWLRQTQRFPVMIRFEEQMPKGSLRVGGQADIMMYTDKSSLMNVFGKIWIRVITWFSYIR